MNKSTIIGVAIAAFTVILASSIGGIQSQNVTVEALDSSTVLLDFKTIPKNEYTILYSSAPSVIASGSIIAKLPCDENSDPRDWMLIGGVRTDLAPIKLELIQGSPGSMCAYIATIPNESAPDISGIVLVNTSNHNIRFPQTSSVVISVQGLSGQQ